mgnify:CR=1 FL=1
MKKAAPYLVLALVLAWVASTLRAPRNPAAFDVQGFGRLPVLVNGRLKPLDTVARSSLLQLQGRQTVTTPDGRFTIVMPHPERVFRNVQMSWRPAAAPEYSGWMRLFRNARVWVG